MEEFQTMKTRTVGIGAAGFLEITYNKSMIEGENTSHLKICRGTFEGNGEREYLSRLIVPLKDNVGFAFSSAIEALCEMYGKEEVE